MSFWKSLEKVAQSAVPLIIGATMPDAIVNTALGTVVKHGTPIPNQAIPVLNLLVSTLLAYVPRAMETGDWVASIIPAMQEGGLLAAVSTGLHQTMKIPLANMVTGNIAAKVGPGDRFSL